MNSWKNRSYIKVIKTRIRILSGVIVLMLAYMVIVGETGRLDSRTMSPLAEVAYRVIFFGGLVCIICKIIHNKKLLTDKRRLKEEYRNEADERAQFLHDKSGGTVMDILLLILLFTTCTAAFYSMPAFYLSAGLLVAAVLLKAGSYFIYNKIS